MAGGGGGSMDVNLQRAYEAAGEISSANATAITGEGQPKYNNYVSEGAGPERFDREMAEVFNFDGIVGEFASAGDDTSVGGICFMQMQYAALAQAARDQRLRRRTRLAQLGHGASRLGAIDANLNGPMLARIQFWLGVGDTKE